MRRLFGVSLVLLVSFCRQAPLGAQSPADTQARLTQDLKFLTSDVCAGRGITTKGIELAAEYIEREFVKAGLKPGGVGGSYYQPFAVTSRAKIGAKPRLVLRGPLGQTITPSAGKGFTVWPLGGTGKLTDAPVVFAGYGIAAPGQKYDDFAGLDVAGKVVLLVAGTPRAGHPHLDIFAGTNDALALSTKIANAAQRKAAAVLIVNAWGVANSTKDQLTPPFMPTTSQDPATVPVVHIQRDLADMMLVSTRGAGLADVEKSIDADLVPRSAALTGWTCTLETEVTHTQVKTKNVVGVLPGSGPLAKETVVIGAHYDHVGFYGSTRAIGKTSQAISGPGSVGGVGFPLALMQEAAIHHGADDNASGTSVVLELARRFGARKDRVGRRLVFVAFSAEESGLLGSQYYSRLAPMAEVAAMINMDQVGRLQDDKLLVGGLGSAREWAPLLEKANERHGFKLTKEMAGPAPSDNASFYFRKVPVFWFFTGFHEHYHRPTDRLETLNVPGLAKLIGLIEDVAVETSVMARPAFQSAPNFDRTKTLWADSPSTGIVPDYADKQTGMLVAEIYKNTAGARAGLKKGDRIQTIAGQPLASATAFLTMARTWKPGTNIELTVERDGAAQNLTLALSPVASGFTDPFLGFVTDLNAVKGGLIITSVLPKTPAALAGLQKGDRITAIGGGAIADRDAYLAILRTLQPGQAIVLTVERGGVKMEHKLQTGK